MSEGRVVFRIEPGQPAEGARRIEDPVTFLRETGLLGHINLWISQAVGLNINVDDLGVVSIDDYGDHPSVLTPADEYHDIRRRMVAFMDSRAAQVQFRREAYGKAIQDDAITAKHARDL